MYKCHCDRKFIINRYVNRGTTEDGDIEIFDNYKNKIFYAESLGWNSFSANGYDEVLLCTECKHVGYLSDFKSEVEF